MNVQDVKLNEFCELSSRTEALPGPDSLAQAVRAYDYIVQYTADGVEVLDAPGYAGVPDDLLELRAFDADGELHAICVEGELRGRVRVDVSGAGDIVFDEEHQLWGRLSAKEDGMAVLREDRGVVVRVPSRALPDIDESSSAVIRVRNYLDEGTIDPESGDTRFAFSDYRFVSFGVREGE